MRPSLLRGGLPILKAVASTGRDPQSFRQRWLWITVGILLVVALTLAPLADPRLGPLTLRLENFLALLFLAAAVGLWLGMGSRAFAVAAVVATALYGLGAFAGFGLQAAHDLETITALVGFLVFALAGFNLVFVLEETLHDADRVLHPKGPILYVTILGLVAAVAIGLPVWQHMGGPMLRIVWFSSVAGLWVLAGYAVLRWSRLIPDQPAVRRELYLFALGVLLAAALVDLVGYLAEATGLLPTLVAYGSLIGTWVYVTYTTLQRTHFLLRGDDARPWMALLLGASFAVLAHAQALFQVEGHHAVEDLFHRRVLYLAAGVWIGIALYVSRGLWIASAWLRGSLRTDRGAIVAGGASQVASGLLAAEDKVERLAANVYRRIDRILPGNHQPPRHTVGWQRELGIDPSLEGIDPDVHDVEFTEIEVPRD